MLRRADSLGVFQVESRAQMAMLLRLRPSKFYRLVVQVAIIRPGPIQGDMVHPYLRRRRRLEEPVYPGPSSEHGDPDELKKVRGRTLSVSPFTTSDPRRMPPSSVISILSPTAARMAGNT
jgi:error-prone DNA polymerase